MQLHAATYELLVLLREFDQCTGWHGVFASCAHWLHWRTGIDLGAAREKVRVAHALASLPLISATMQRGVISYAKVRATDPCGDAGQRVGSSGVRAIGHCRPRGAPGPRLAPGRRCDRRRGGRVASPAPAAQHLDGRRWHGGDSRPAHARTGRCGAAGARSGRGSAAFRGADVAEIRDVSRRR